MKLSVHTFSTIKFSLGFSGGVGFIGISLERLELLFIYKKRKEFGTGKLDVQYS